jgi:lysophospholipase L1-like esterase
MRLALIIFFQALIVLGAFLFAEGASRVAYTIKSDPRRQSWFTYEADVGWDRRSNFTGLDDCGNPRTFDDRGLVAADATRLRSLTTKFRALFLGDSNTYGICLNTSQTFVEIANKLVPQAVSVNLGVPGYTSYQGFKSLLKYGDLLEPKIIFVSFNFNDRRYVVQEAQIDNDATFRRLYDSRFVRYLAESSYLWRFAAFLSRRLMSADLGTAESGKLGEVQVDRLRPRVDPQSYRMNLTKIALWARQHGVPAVFILLHDNPNETYSLRQGIKYLDEKNYELAIKYLQFAIDRPKSSFSALARLYLSRAYTGIGMKNEAQEVLSFKNALVTVRGGDPVALDSEYNNIMRDVAEQFGDEVIDAGSELDKTPSVYFDFCHFDAQGQAIVGKLVADAIKSAGVNTVAAMGR